MPHTPKKNVKELERIKKIIVRQFYAQVKGKRPDTSASNKKHSGKEGHWLEKQMGIKHNASNAPDLHGFEMKNQTRSKTTFGDWSADYYIFKDKAYEMTRDDFLRIFGMPNPEKKGRFSWSGKPCPKVGAHNICGQIMMVDSKNNILAVYDYSKDGRPDKAKIVPKVMQKKNLVLAKWEAGILSQKLERKFNKLGWFQCKKGSKGVYSGIVFGEPIVFENWIKGVRKGSVFFDSGMYHGNKRPYSQWRADNKYWDDLITSRY